MELNKMYGHLVSVIVPMHNSEKTIRRCLESILRQDYGSYEIIVVDDGSNDGSLSEARLMRDPHIKVYPMAHGGVSAARNYGLDKASGKYLMFLDSDDEMEPGAISTLVDYASKNNAKIVKFASYGIEGGARRKVPISGLVNKIYDPNNRNDVSELTDLLFKIKHFLPCYMQTLFIARELVEEKKIRFDTSKYFMEDAIFHLDVFSTGERIHVLDKYLQSFYINTNTTTKNKKNNHRNAVGSLDSIWVVLGRIGNDKKVAARYVKIVYGYLAGEKDDGEVFYEDAFSEKMCKLAELADMKGEKLFWKAVKWTIVHKRRSLSRILANVCYYYATVVRQKIRCDH